MVISKIRIGALIYTISNSEISFISIDENANRQIYCAGKTYELLLKIENLHEELSDSFALATGNVPLLNIFIEEWGKFLLPPLVWFANIDILVIVPEGIIHGIPLHLIRFDKEFLGTLVGVTYSSSLSLFSKCVNQNRVRAKNITDWEFNENIPLNKKTKQINAIIGGVDVLGNQNNTFKEIASQISNYIKGQVTNFSSEDSTKYNEFTRNSLKTIFRRTEMANMLCVVAHGYIDTSNHRMSGLLLAKDSIGILSRNIPLHGGRYFDFRDLPLQEIPIELEPQIDTEILTSAELEIDGILNSELVVLLGCSTASGRIFPGDVPASLAETFLQIGASSVIASSWDIDSDFIKEWNRLFFEGWLTYNLPKALAYRRTLRMLNIEPWINKPERLGSIILKGDWL